MRDIIIETEAMSRFDTAVDEVAAADHGLSGFILAYGLAGRTPGTGGAETPAIGHVFH